MNHVIHHSHIAGLGVGASGMSWSATRSRQLPGFIAGACAPNGSFKRVFAGF